MSKISVTLDAVKLRNLVSQRTYRNKDGQDVNVQEVKFELVPVKEPKTIYTKDNLRIDKTHFAAAIKKSKEEDTVYIGEGFTTVWLNDIKVHEAEVINPESKEEDFPF